MTFQIPNTFIPGTKAKANEVNENFNAVRTELASQAALISQNTKSISTISTNFTSDLSNKLGFTDIPEVLSGLTLSYADGTLTIASGFCLDSTRKKFMKLKTDFYKDTTSIFVEGTGNGLMFESTMDASTIYNVFLISKEDSTVDVIATKDAAPRLSGDFVYYAKIGYFFTDENAAITKVFPEMSLNELFLSGKVGYNYFPDYSKGVGKAWGTVHTAEADGWLAAYSYGWEQSYTNPTLTISGASFKIVGCAGMLACSTLFMPVSKNETYIAHSGVTNSLTYYPVKGIN